VPPAVDDEACRSNHVHALIERRLASHLAQRKQQIAAEDQRSADPARNFDQDLFGAQTASLLST
jgi:hypothetical protein